MMLLSPLALFILCGIVVGLSLFLTGRLHVFLRQKAIWDMPNDRSSHQIATPRGGGIVIVGGLILLWGGLGFALALDLQYWVGWCVGLCLLAMISFFDDVMTLSALSRFSGQILVVILMLAVLPTFGLAPTPKPIFLPILKHMVSDSTLRDQIDLCLQGLCWLWFINLYNFMDGIDGLAGGETICISLGLICVFGVMPSISAASELSLLCWLIISLTLGFLWWNKPPAQIFMGDVGSVPLGFILGALLLYLAGYGGQIAALLLPGYFLVDTTSRLVIRICQRQKVWQAHNQHFYQQALKRGLAHDQVSLTIMGGNIFLICLSFGSVYFTKTPGWVWIVGGSLTISGVIAIFMLRPQN